jgi:hypothetical protein
MTEPVCCRWCGQDFEATKAMHAENARLQELLRSEGGNRYWEGRWRDEFADNTRLRELLSAVVREADRETNAFIAARAALAYDPAKA